MKTREQAERFAKRTIKQLHGKGWRARVWNNTGWHVAFFNRGLNVHSNAYVNGPASFFALLSDEDGGSGGLAAWSPGHKCFRDPNKAAQAAINAARAYVNHLNHAVETVEKIYARSSGRNLA